jgi:putative transposase
VTGPALSGTAGTVFDAARQEALEELAPLVGRAGACRAVGVNRPTWYAHHRQSPAPPRPKREPKPHPKALSWAERDEVLAVLHSERFVDTAPEEVYATLLDEGVYLCSASTMYRLLRERGEVRERRRQAVHPPRKKPELMADAVNTVWSWDVTKLRGPEPRVFYFLYTMIDIYSRYTVAWMVTTCESEELARQFIREAQEKQQVPEGQLTIHSDRGAIQTAKSVAVLMADLGVTRSHSRPKVSNDNPYSEAQYKTLKYRPDFPDRFTGLAHARDWCRDFFDWYHHDHRHSGIGWHTPHDLHHGLAQHVRDYRADILTDAYARHPERFVNKHPEPPALPEQVWINKPTDQHDEQETTNSAQH